MQLRKPDPNGNMAKDAMNTLAKKINFNFSLAVLLLCLVYLSFEAFFVFYGALSADEFVFARHIYEYTFHLPYRDFAPYKTVLGYYLLSLPMFFSTDILQPLFLIKLEIAIINTLAMGLAYILLSKLYPKHCVFFSMFLMSCNLLFLIYASDLRVDMLTAWGCLFASIFVLRRQFEISGFILGLSFLISQKAIWYVIAINSGCIAAAYIYSNSSFNWRQILRFNLWIIFPIIIYCVIWSYIADVRTVFDSLFYEAYIQAGIELYTTIYFVCWWAVLYNGPFIFLTLPLVFLSFTDTRSLNTQRIFILFFSIAALLQFIHYKQPFPYNFVFTFPALFLLYLDFFSWLNRSSAELKLQFDLSLIFSVSFYCFILGSLVYLLALPQINFLYIILPMLFLAYFYKKQSQKPILSKSISISLIILSAILGYGYPLYRSLTVSTLLDGSYQRSIIRLARQLTKDGSTYLGGMPFLYTKDQLPNGLGNLIEPALNYLFTPNQSLQQLLLPSLYLQPISPEQALQEFKSEPIKLIINNYRIRALPINLHRYIENNYRQFEGSLYLYAPLVPAKQEHVNIKFAGNYQVKTQDNFTFIDHQHVAADSIINLKRGLHQVQSTNGVRLVLIPDLPESIKPRYGQDEWMRMIKAIVT